MNKRIILSTVSCVGVGALVWSTHRDTIKAARKLEEGQKETLKTTWKCYIPTATITMLTILSIILNHKLTNKELLAMAGTAGATARVLKEYKDKVRALYGDQAIEDIQKAIAKDHEDGIINAATPCISSCGAFNTLEDEGEPGKDLFYDLYSNRWFRSSKEAVRLAEYHINRNFALGGCVTIGDFYDFLGIPATKHDREFGWGFGFIEGGCYWIDAEHTVAHKEDTGEEYTIIEFVFPPEELDACDM